MFHACFEEKWPLHQALGGLSETGWNGVADVDRAVQMLSALLPWWRKRLGLGVAVTGI